MATMNISLPDDLKDYVDGQVGAEGYASASEYVRFLVRLQRDKDRLRAMLLEGANSGPGSIIDDDYFDGLRQRIASGQLIDVE
ncbi:MAG: type II toxin-antitoxin system ParD family antitoxin [Bifidobacteriaceae bacterium]|nr:type II toxin-antitoxin system ParD family antitoxin [Bifidobacteriaceae bacterium]